MFSRMFTIACCLVVGLRLGLGSDLVSGWFVVIYACPTNEKIVPTLLTKHVVFIRINSYEAVLLHTVTTCLEYLETWKCQGIWL